MEKRWVQRRRTTTKRHKKPQSLSRTGVSQLRPDNVLLSHGNSHTTIGAKQFHFWVRYGIRWYLLAKVIRQAGVASSLCTMGLVRVADTRISSWATKFLKSNISDKSFAFDIFYFQTIFCLSNNLLSFKQSSVFQTIVLFQGLILYSLSFSKPRVLRSALHAPVEMTGVGVLSSKWRWRVMWSKPQSLKLYDQASRAISTG